MAIPIAPLPEGTRVKVVQGPFPQDPALLGRLGIVVITSEYQNQSVGVVLDEESSARFFVRSELEVEEAPKLPPEREVAKQRRALP
jgi:hypothetical protein